MQCCIKEDDVFKTKKLTLLLIVLLAMPVILAACGGDDNDDGAKAAELSQTFESSTGLKVEYPEGWIARDGDSGPEIANSQQTLDAMDATEEAEVPEDGFALLLLNPADMALPGLETMDAKAVLEMFAGFMAGEGTDEGMKIGEIEETKVGDYAAVRLSVTDSTIKSEGFMLAYKLDDTTVIFAVAMAHDGKLGDFENTALEIIKSIEYTAPAAAG